DDEPVTVSWALPSAAPSAAVTVSVALCPAVTEVGWKVAVTPLGRPEIAKPMSTALPVVTAVVTVKVVDEPAWTVRLDRPSALRSAWAAGAGVRVPVAVAVCVPGAAVPVMVKGPPAAAGGGWAVRGGVVICPADTVSGLKLPVTPAGSPLTESAIGWALPEAT